MEDYIRLIMNETISYNNKDSRDWQHAALLRKQCEQELKKIIKQIQNDSNQQIINKLKSLYLLSLSNLKGFTYPDPDDVEVEYFDIMEKIENIVKEFEDDLNGQTTSN